MRPETHTVYDSTDTMTTVELDEEGGMVATCEESRHGTKAVEEGALIHDAAGWHVLDTSGQMILSKPTKDEAMEAFGLIATTKAVTWAVNR